MTYFEGDDVTEKLATKILLLKTFARLKNVCAKYAHALSSVRIYIGVINE